MKRSGHDLIPVLMETASAMVETIRALSGDDTAMLQSALRRLNSDQFDFVYDVLELEITQGRMTRREFHRFESFVDRWWTHDLSMKLAFLNQICAFTNFDDWPVQYFPELEKLRIDYGVKPCHLAGRELS